MSHSRLKAGLKFMQPAQRLSGAEKSHQTSVVAAEPELAITLPVTASVMDAKAERFLEVSFKKLTTLSKKTHFCPEPCCQ